jgi:hypothetical protein
MDYRHLFLAQHARAHTAEGGNLDFSNRCVPVCFASFAIFRVFRGPEFYFSTNGSLRWRRKTCQNPRLACSFADGYGSVERQHPTLLL